MNHCPICTRKPYVAFNWEYAIKGKDQELATLAGHLQPLRPLKFGHLYHCPVCQGYWFLDDGGSLMYSVPSDKVELLSQWDRQSLVITDAQMEALAQIGATGFDEHKRATSELVIPCAVRRAPNEFYDPALVMITRVPPIRPWQKRALLGSQNDVIVQSDFALPLPVRMATRYADEINMGFAPTLVKSNDDQYFVLSGAKQIFSHGQLRGKDISLSERPFRRGDNFPILNEDIEQLTFFFYDWHEDCRKLIRNQ